jgi:ATP synthase protein I
MDQDKRADQDKAETSRIKADSELSSKLKRLGDRIGLVKAARDQQNTSHKGASSDSSALAQAFRLSAEFVSGIIAGGIIGFALDKLADIAPLGLIIGLILGFCAGMFNLMRAAGLVKPARMDQKREDKDQI